LTPDYENLFKRLAEENRLYIIAGTHRIVQEGEVFNAAHLFTPNGQVFRQKKVHLTPTEKTIYLLSRGHGFYVYQTEYGRIAILVCYDVEFPEAARVLAEAGAEILFVPSCTNVQVSRRDARVVLLQEASSGASPDKVIGYAKHEEIIRAENMLGVDSLPGFGSFPTDAHPPRLSRNVAPSVSRRPLLGRLFIENNCQ
jgi:predicted amidohydrolase